jgi:hypothetical protein
MDEGRGPGRAGSGVERGIQVELGLGRGKGAAPGRSSGREAEVIENALCGRIVVDDGDRAHGALAARADEDVDGEGPF